MSIHDDIDALSSGNSANVTAAFRALLQEKHLYQSVEVDSKVIEDAVEKHRGQPILARLLAVRIALKEKDWQPMQVAQKSEGTLNFTVPHIKIFCRVCKRVEAFNPHLFNNIVHLPPPGPQFFLMTYQCQSCRGVPEAFLITRKGIKLTLTGRSPIETTVVPQVIPKEDHQFYSDAQVAFQSGQTLAGNFLLRTFIEQFLRKRSPMGHKQPESLLEEYAKDLPTDFKSRFPSLTELYAKLSADIHDAVGSSELYLECQQKLLKHFEARALFNLPDTILLVKTDESGGGNQSKEQSAAA